MKRLIALLDKRTGQATLIRPENLILEEERGARILGHSPELQEDLEIVEMNDLRPNIPWTPECFKRDPSGWVNVRFPRQEAIEMSKWPRKTFLQWAPNLLGILTVALAIAAFSIIIGTFFILLFR